MEIQIKLSVLLLWPACYSVGSIILIVTLQALVPGHPNSERYTYERVTTDATVAVVPMVAKATPM